MIRLTLALAGAAFAGLGGASLSAEIYTPGQPVHGKFKDLAEDFLFNHCYDCHDDDTQKGDLNLLEQLGPVDETNAAVWKSVAAIQPQCQASDQEPGVGLVVPAGPFARPPARAGIPY